VVTRLGSALFFFLTSCTASTTPVSDAATATDDAAAPPADATTGPTSSRVTIGENGLFLVNDQPAFPIGLSMPPAPGSLTPSGADALDEVVAAGVTFWKVQPEDAAFSDADLDGARRNLDAAAARGVTTWINLRDLAASGPDSPAEARLREVVAALKEHPALGFWKGADEPWWQDIPAAALANAYQEARALDPDHPWVIIEAPRGTAADLRPYADVTDGHGVDVFPVAFGEADPDLHEVGVWTKLLHKITPNRAVIATLQICFSGSDNEATGDFVMPTRKQERFMIYDAIMNGARGVNFFGGSVSLCLEGRDAELGWQWTFWESVLRDLIAEIGPASPIYPALLAPNTGLGLASDDPNTQVLSRQVGDEVWVIAGRRGSGSRTVRISGLPADLADATVYTEDRTLTASGGAFSDSFDRWAVHVYHFAGQ
jgi:hypothetical protein